MRIGLITGEYPPMEGGVGAFTHELAAALAQLGHEPFVLTDYHVPSSNTNGIHVAGSVHGWNRASLFAVRYWAEANHLDVINIQYEAAAYQMAQLVHFLPHRLRPFATVTTFHDLLVPYLFPKAGLLRWQALLTLARGSNGVIVTNVQDEQRLSAAGGIRQLANIPIGSNIAAELPSGYDRAVWREVLHVPPHAMLVGYFGFMNASKGVDTLLNAAALAGQQGQDMHLLLIGGPTGASDPTNARHAQEIEELIAQLGLLDRVRRTGFVEGSTVSAHLTACDMLALPYRDGVSLRRGSLMAALAHGCAIISTRPEVAMPEIVDHENMLLVPSDSPEQLAAAIRELSRDPDLRARLQTGAKALSARFGWDQIAAQTVRFFDLLHSESHR